MVVRDWHTHACSSCNVKVLIIIHQKSQALHLLKLVQTNNVLSLESLLGVLEITGLSGSPFSIDFNVNEDGETLLHHAAKKINAKTISLLLNHGADPNNPGNDFLGVTPLMALCQSARSGRVPVEQVTQSMNALLNGGAKVNAIASQTDTMCTALMSEVLHGDPSNTAMMKLLLAKNADPNLKSPSDGTYPLLAATHTSKTSYVEALLSANADPHNTNHEGQIALDFAQGSDVKVISLLVKAMAPDPPPPWEKMWDDVNNSLYYRNAITYAVAHNLDEISDLMNMTTVIPDDSNVLDVHSSGDDKPIIGLGINQDALKSAVKPPSPWVLHWNAKSQSVNYMNPLSGIIVETIAEAVRTSLHLPPQVNTIATDNQANKVDSDVAESWMLSAESATIDESDVLGRGSFADVFGGTYSFAGSQQNVAFKRFRSLAKSSLKESANELTVSISLRHMNIIRTYGALATDGGQYLVLERVAGQSLRAKLDEYNSNGAVVDWAERESWVKVRFSLLLLRSVSS